MHWLYLLMCLDAFGDFLIFKFQISDSYSQTSPYECSNCFKKDEQLSLFEQRQHNQERGTLGLEQTISDGK